MAVDQHVQRVRLVAGFERHIGAKAQNVVLVDPDGRNTGFSSPPGSPWKPGPDKVRARLYKILAEAWLPEEEGAQLRFEFEMELVRLEAA
jgi:hypothetical protein